MPRRLDPPDELGEPLVGLAQTDGGEIDHRRAPDACYNVVHHRDHASLVSGPLRPRGRPRQAQRCRRRLGGRRQRAPDPRRQRLRDGIPDQPGAVRRPHPQHLRGCRGDPGAGDRTAVAERVAVRPEKLAGGGQLRLPSRTAAAASDTLYEIDVCAWTRRQAQELRRLEDLRLDVRAASTMSPSRSRT